MSDDFRHDDFIKAVRNGDEKLAVEIVQADPRFINSLPEEPDVDAMYYAATFGQLALVERFFDMGGRQVQLALGAACRSPVTKYRPIIEYLLTKGADINGLYSDEYGPSIFVPCENLQPDVLEMLIDLGADPNFQFTNPDGEVVTPLKMLLGTYVRRPANLHACIDCLQRHSVSIEDSPSMAVYRGYTEALARHLDADPSLVRAKFDFNSANTALQGATLLHLAAETCELACARLLLDRGAGVNAVAGVDAEGFGGQTPIFHTVNSIWNAGFPVCELIVNRGADLAHRCDVRHLGFQRTFKHVTALGYAIQMARDNVPHQNVVELLQKHGAVQ